MRKYLLLISDFSLLLLLVLLLPKHVEAFNNETVIYEGEKYIQKEHIFIPWGEAESLVGYIPGGTTNEGTPEEMVWPGNTNLIVEDSDNDINKNQIFEDEEWEALHEKMNLAQDGDMWFVAHNIGKNNTLTNNIDHMGMYLEIETTSGVLVPRIIHASSGEDKVILDINPKENRFWNGEWERAIFRGLRRR